MPGHDCSADPNRSCPACGLYLQDALPYVHMEQFHLAKPGTAHSLVRHACPRLHACRKPDRVGCRICSRLGHVALLPIASTSCEGIMEQGGLVLAMQTTPVA